MPGYDTRGSGAGSFIATGANQVPLVPRRTVFDQRWTNNSFHDWSQPPRPAPFAPRRTFLNQGWTNNSDWNQPPRPVLSSEPSSSRGNIHPRCLFPTIPEEVFVGLEYSRMRDTETLLVVQVDGSSPPPAAIYEWLETLEFRTGLRTTFDKELDGGIFTIRGIDDEQAAAITGFGGHQIDGKLTLIQRWTQQFHPLIPASMLRIIWIRIPWLPDRLRRHGPLRKLLNEIGKVIFMRITPSDAGLESFHARACLGVSLEVFTSQIEVKFSDLKTHIIRIIWGDELLRCWACHSVAHRFEKCPNGPYYGMKPEDFQNKSIKELSAPTEGGGIRKRRRDLDRSLFCTRSFTVCDPGEGALKMDVRLSYAIEIRTMDFQRSHRKKLLKTLDDTEREWDS